MLCHVKLLNHRTECLQIVYEALVQALGGPGSESIGEAVLFTDYLQKTESVLTMVQWIPSHEIADGLANKRRKVNSTAAETTYFVRR
ncbi:hypothetical protein PoB_001758500 [Plakobranchus ocellatus]|uniref:Uncharacterized protein n=1 Tax=Plakobranchus ocellatus TaxID=259542 RepID=A0AAV3Z7I0_9GAST|nr:hypothetical protein PoB_001758500 [Plakobranchus ocellatus]